MCALLSYVPSALHFPIAGRSPWVVGSSSPPPFLLCSLDGYVQHVAGLFLDDTQLPLDKLGSRRVTMSEPSMQMPCHSECVLRQSIFERPARLALQLISSGCSSSRAFPAAPRAQTLMAWQWINSARASEGFRRPRSISSHSGMFSLMAWSPYHSTPTTLANPCGEIPRTEAP